MKSSLLRKIVIGTFLSVPAISSVISTIHLIDLFNLGNPTWLSILLAVTFELGSIASLLAISVIDRIKVGAIWFIFFILSALQIIGNVYYSYSFTSDQILSNPTFLANFMDLFSFITGDELKDVKIFLSCIIGIPIPLIALFFLKSNIDYLRPDPSKKMEEKKEELTPKEEKPAPKAKTEKPIMKPHAETIITQEEASPSIQHPQEETSDLDGDDPSLSDHVILNPEKIEQQEEQHHEVQIETEATDVTVEPSSNEEQTIEESENEADKKTGRSPKPMISQRRRDAMSVLHRG